MHLHGICLLLSQGFNDFIAMVPKVSQRGENIPHRQLRKIFDDFIRAFPLKFMPHIHIQHTDAGSSDAGFSTADGGIAGDVNFLGRRGDLAHWMPSYHPLDLKTIAERERHAIANAPPSP